MNLRLHISFFCLLLFFGAGLPSYAVERRAERTWLFGVGHNALYDAYLSPLDYRGTMLGMTMLNDRRAHWGKGQVTRHIRLEVQGTWAKNAAKNADFYDGNADFRFGWHYNWRLSSWHLRLGGLAGFDFGGTYSTRNGNNPAQGRAAFDVRCSAIADYHFNIRQNHCAVWLSAEAPLAGLMFSPQYGQSYYEIFSLGHYDCNVRPTYPGNVPTLRMAATLTFPVRRANMVVGYGCDIVQSRVNHLDRHAWGHSLLVGFTRSLSF